jgi:hypothetical protein
MKETKIFTYDNEPFYLVNDSMGSFLEPPFSLTYKYSIMYGRRRFENKSMMSIDYFLNDMIEIPKELKDMVRKLLPEVKIPEITSPDIQKWICEVRIYFKNCYSKDGIDRSASNCLIINDCTDDINKDLGVMHIREHYPEYKGV